MGVYKRMRQLGKINMYVPLKLLLSKFRLMHDMIVFVKDGGNNLKPCCQHYAPSLIMNL